MKKFLLILVALSLLLPVQARKKTYVPRLQLNKGTIYQQRCEADMNMKATYQGQRNYFREHVTADMTFEVLAVSDTLTWLKVHYDSVSYASWTNDNLVFANSQKADNTLCLLLKQLEDKPFTVVLTHKGVAHKIIGLNELVHEAMNIPGVSEEEKAVLESFNKKMIENVFGAIYPNDEVAMGEKNRVGDYLGYADYMPTSSNVTYMLKSANRERYDVLMSGRTDIEYIDEIGDSWAQYAIVISDDIRQERSTGWTLSQNLAMQNCGVMVSEGMTMPLEMMIQVKVFNKDNRSTIVEN